MSRSLLAGLLLAPVLVAAPVPKEDDTARMRRIYGQTDDPDKDCAFEMVGEKLRIKIPAKHHSLNPNPGRMNAPRVVKEVEGDFTVTVRVTFPIRPAPGPEADKDFLAFATAGLIAWADGDSVQFVRKEHRLGQKPRESFSRRWTRIRPGEKGVSDAVRALELTGGPDSAYLCLERKEQKVTASFSRDGKEWSPQNRIASVEVEWKEKVKVGVIAENGYNAAFEATFDEYKLTVP